MPRFARQNYQKVLFQFLTLHYILLHYLHFFVYINMCLGLEEDLTIDNILGSLNLVILVFVKGELEVVRITNPRAGHIQLAMSEHLH